MSSWVLWVERPSPSSYSKPCVAWGYGRQREGQKGQARRLLGNRDMKSNQDLPHLRCFVLGNSTVTLDSVKQSVLVRRSLPE